MRPRTATLGVLFATTTAIVWGGQFVVGKSALESVNAFPLSTIRYALAAALWLLVLVVGEMALAWFCGRAAAGSGQEAPAWST